MQTPTPPPSSPGLLPQRICIHNLWHLPIGNSAGGERIITHAFSTAARSHQPSHWAVSQSRSLRSLPALCLCELFTDGALGGRQRRAFRRQLVGTCRYTPWARWICDIWICISGDKHAGCAGGSLATPESL